MNAPFNSMSCHKAFPKNQAGRASPSAAIKKKRAAFSLIELLISLAVLSVLVVLAASLIGTIQDVWKRSSARTEQFRSARQALETISARLSQATLNPYWVVQTNASGVPVRYERQSDLRFLTAQAPTLTALAQPGGALFFQAPTGYSHAEAATLTCAGLTAWRALVVIGNIKAGDVVLTQGTGGVSIFALQFAKAAGATVISTTSNADKAARLKALGADHVINYKDDAEWGRTAKKLTGGRGVDHVVEIGGAGTIEQSMRASRLGGHISLIGVLAGYAGSINTALLMSMQIRLIGITVGARQHQQDMIRAIEANGIKPVLDQSFPLTMLAEAFRRQESGQHFGKIIVEW